MNNRRTNYPDTSQEPLVLTNWQLRLHLPARPGLPRPTPATRNRCRVWRANTARLSAWTILVGTVLGHLLARRP